MEFRYYTPREQNALSLKLLRTLHAGYDIATLRAFKTEVSDQCLFWASSHCYK